MSAALTRQPRPFAGSLHLEDLRELADLLVGVGGHDQVAQLRLERWLKMRGFGEEANRVA
jgi:hypothetical protein